MMMGLFVSNIFFFDFSLVHAEENPKVSRLNNISREDSKTLIFGGGCQEKLTISYRVQGG